MVRTMLLRHRGLGESDLATDSLVAGGEAGFNQALLDPGPPGQVSGVAADSEQLSPRRTRHMVASGSGESSGRLIHSCVRHHKGEATIRSHRGPDSIP